MPQSVWTDPIFLSADDIALPETSREFLVSRGLPRVMIFEWQNSFEISFSPLQSKLLPYNTSVRWGDFFDHDLDERWTSEFIVGEEEFCNGSASYCLNAKTGYVSRIDCQLSIPQSFVNSSVELFSKSLLVAKEWSDSLRTTRMAPSRDTLTQLADSLECFDPAAFANSDNIWRNLIELMLDELSSLTSVVITDDASYSKPRF